MSFARRIEKVLRTPGRTPLAGILLVLALAACTTGPRDARKAAPATPVLATVTPSKAAPEKPPAVDKQVVPVPQQLLGMTPVSVTALLGEPKLIRSEPPAQVWLYRNEACVFHVYLYASGAGRAYSVTHIAAVSLYGEAIAIDGCFSATVTGAQRNPQSS